nr:uncharacterized protein LOC109169281 [Ipomoea batatas]GME17867.1 uncharacterized protein LOC109169281 [Ipomoea batatas]GME20896.1 uncharacterized protein LOC109169281 [Ipomoea batatas]
MPMDTDTSNRERTSRLGKLKMELEDKIRKEVCEKLLQLKLMRDDSENPRENGTTAKGSNDDYTKSILSEAIKLAKHLRRWCREGRPNPENEQDVENPGSNGQDNHCSEEELWEVVSHVWIGMLLYGASHCREDAQYLNKGGELLTLVRLLMVHFGSSEMKVVLLLDSNLQQSCIK